MDGPKAVRPRVAPADDDRVLVLRGDEPIARDVVPLPPFVLERK